MVKRILIADKILLGKDLTVAEDKAVVICNGKIEKIIDKSEVKSFDGYEIVDLGNKTIMPGMIECHNHLCIDARIPDHLELLAEASEAELTLISLKGLKDDLMSGVTTARCMGDKYYIDVNLKKKIEDGSILGPRLLTAGIGMKGSHGAGYIGSPHCGPEEFRKTARENMKKGVNVLKLFATPGVAPVGQDFIPSYLSREEIGIVVEEGRRLNIPIAAHCIGAQALIDCVEMGVDVIEHAYAAVDSDIELMKKHGTWVDLTSGIFMDEAREEFLSQANVDKTRFHKQNVINALSKVVKGGVPFVIGTDANHGLLYKEIGFALELGADIVSALKGITSNAAYICKMDHQIGSIEEGLLADIIAVNGNPIENYECLADVSFVMKSGKIYKKSADVTAEVETVVLES